MKENAYKKAGVDIKAGDDLVHRIKPHVKKTDRSGWMGGIGGFGAFFDLNAVRSYKRPVLVSSTDGVGTKLKIALATGNHTTIGIDCVAMCVNDIVVHGAEPLYFLDYYATGKLDPDTAEKVITGIANGCSQAGCALVGGETAEMPGMYSGEDYDVAGFAVGAVEKEEIINGEGIQDGDVIFALASNGLHSNGFSLVRKLVESTESLAYDRPEYFTGDKTLGQTLLTPTRIYVKSLLEALSVRDGSGKPAIKGMAHITGGGISGNLARILPKDHCARIDAAKWRCDPVFGWLQKLGNLDAGNMLQTFNCGVGMAVVCSRQEADSVREALSRNETVFEIGTIKIKQGKNAVEYENLDKLCRSEL